MRDNEFTASKDPRNRTDFRFRVDGCSADEVRAVEALPESSGAHLLFLTSGGTNGDIMLWDSRIALSEGAVASAAPVCSEVLTEPAGHGRRVTGLSAAPDGQSFVSCSFDQSVKCWDMRHLDAPVNSADLKSGNVFDVAFAPDGASVLVAYTEPRLWLEPRSGSDHTLENNFTTAFPCTTNALAATFSPRNDILAFGGTGGALHIYCSDELEDPSMADSADINTPGDVRGLSFSFEGGVMAVGWENGGTAAYRRNASPMMKSARKR
jgi:WD40 repeat protein